VELLTGGGSWQGFYDALDFVFMSLTQQRKIYQSENGDSWWLSRGNGEVYVVHQANLPSGGMVTRIELADMLGGGTKGPEKRALLEMIGALTQCEF
jgi:hypothetical protein